MFVQELKDKFPRYIITWLIVVLFFILIRAFEYFYVILTHSATVSAELFITRSINYDMLFVVGFSIVFLLPYAIIHFFSPRLALVSAQAAALLLVFLKLALVHFFLSSQTLLNSSLLNFSLSEVRHIVSAEFTYNRIPLWLSYIAFIPLSAFSLFVLPNKLTVTKKIFRGIVVLYIAVSAVTLANRKYFFKSLRYFDSKYHYLLGNNEFVYFLKSLRYESDKSYQVAGFLQRDVDRMAAAFQSLFPGKGYIGREYPLVHVPSAPNVLGEYFTASDSAPNIVLVISESLSSSFCGTKPALGHLTPFTDSLRKHSLYWENFMSNADRTYGALPNILASLPYGTDDRGFINMKTVYAGNEIYPHFTGLVDQLNDNGYFTGWYYGGWGFFDNAIPFMKKCAVSLAMDESMFDTTRYRKKGGNADQELVWGYADKDLFSQSFAYLDKQKPGQPFLSIYQTLSFHSPYNMVDSLYANSHFLDERLRKLNVPAAATALLSKPVIASIVYADDALRDLFERYKKRPDFNRTLFIITGDHSNNFNMQNKYIEEYLVPLIIYSPMLVRPAVFRGVCSHIDIMPSLQALLSNHYKLRFSEHCHWVGAGLDTSRTFRSARMVPLNINSVDMPNFILHNNLVLSGNVYRFDSLFNFIEEPDPAKKAAVQSAFDAYRYINSYVCIDDKIWSRNKRKTNVTK